MRKVFEIIINTKSLIKKNGKGGRERRLNKKKMFVLFQESFIGGNRAIIVNIK